MGGAANRRQGKWGGPQAKAARLGVRQPSRAIGLGRLAWLSGRLDSRDELADVRRDLFAEAGAVEDAVMADPFGQQIVLPRLRDVDAQFIGGIGLADARDV